MASAAPITGAPRGAPKITDLSICGTTPFLSGADIVDQALRCAYSLAAAFESTHTSIAELPYKQREEISIANLNHELVAAGYDAIGVLVALAQHGHDLAQHERSAR